MSEAFPRLLAKLEIKQRKKVTFKVIETHGMPICRNDGTLVDGYLHAKECKNFQCDGINVIGSEMFAERLNILHVRKIREQEIDKLFKS